MIDIPTVSLADNLRFNVFHIIPYLSRGVFTESRFWVSVWARNHARLTADRAVHQQQLAGSAVTLTLGETLPREIDGLGIFQRGQSPGSHRIGIGRISTLQGWGVRTRKRIRTFSV